MGLKGLSCFLAGLVFSVGCSGCGVYKTANLRDTIGYENVELKHLDELEFLEEKATLPTDLEELVNFPVFRKYKDKEKFRKELYEKHGLSRKSVRAMTPHELIVKSADIVADNFIFELDKNPKIDGFIEEDWEGKTGDCSMYSVYTGYIFNLLKEDNKNAENVYVTDSYFLGRPVRHLWNSVFVVSKERIQIGMVDPTFYDGKDALEALDDFHLSKAWKTNFYRALIDYESSRKQLVEDIKQVEDEREKKGLLKRYALSFYIDGEYEQAIDAYQDLSVIYPELTPDSLYYQGKCFLYLEEKEKAREKFLKLVEKYPESYWCELVKKEKLID